MLAVQPLSCRLFEGIGVTEVSVSSESHLNRNNLTTLCEAVAAKLPNFEINSLTEKLIGPTVTFSASVTFKASPGKAMHGFLWSEPSNIYFAYPYKLFLPRPSIRSASPTRWIYPVVYGGGLVSGDNLNIRITCNENTSVLVTSHAFNKVYKAKEGQVTCMTNRFEVRQKALLSVLPDFTVCYADANYRSQEQTIYLQNSNSNFIYLDWYSSGRIAIHERWHFTYLNTSLKIYMGDELILREATILEDVENLSIVERMDEFNVFGLLFLYGNIEVITDLRERILADLTTRESYGVAAERQNLFCASLTKHGICVVRFACTDCRAAYLKIEKLLSPLYGLYGGNPFHNKY
ncbi:urease accessory protein UreD-like [Tropilaelaps mercedesae]|uniref:Urease accessory protein UreD-like n=1 Tax=Tropilaelaps mercedesae TaxID=418985 RepID=A0A1V9XQY1_9ACAR|nr:urease accessory protein UreD-like [Tropilaelaps mercedesae]